MVSLVLGLCLSLCSLLVSGDRALVVARVEVVGNSVIEAERILKEFGVARGDSLRDGEVPERVKRVLDAYREVGHWRAKIEVDTSQLEDGRVNLRLNVEEGEPVLVREIAIEGNSLFSDSQILSGFETRRGAIFRESAFKEDVDQLLSRYANHGHPFASVSPKDFSVDSSGVKFSLPIEEGPLVVIEGLEVRGNEVTRPWVILRETGIKEGEIYSQDRVERGKRRIGRLPFLAGAPEIELRAADGMERVHLVVKVLEGMMNRASGAIGWAPGEDGDLTGLVDLSLGNLFGTGRRIEAWWRRVSPLSSSVELAYVEPWFLGQELDLSFQFSHAIRDTSYAETGLGLGVELPLGEDLSGTSSVGWERVIPQASPIPKTRKYKGSIGAVLDTRDDRKNPKRGVLYKFSTEYGYKWSFPSEPVIVSGQRARVLKGQFNFHNYVEVFSNQVVYLSLNGGEVRSTESYLPFVEHFRLGGGRTLRGYYEEQFSGERVGWANLEYRFLLGRGSRVAPFLDGGYFQYRTEAGALVKASKVGYGVGLRVGAGWGVFFLDYGLGEGDRPLDGKVHFGAETEF